MNDKKIEQLKLVIERRYNVTIEEWLLAVAVM
jgi:hypothetical protein